jgi:F-type H+-transporting ATPase subunit b
VLRPLLRATLFAGLLFLGSNRSLHAQTANENQAAGTEPKENENPDATWHLINTGLFAVGLGWAIWKMAPGFFNTRSADIQRAIKEATGLKMEADLRYSEIDRKMATLPDEVKRMKEQSAIEMEREHRRRQEETSREVRRIEQASAAEIEALRQEAIRAARQRTARSALQLAEERLAAQVSAASNQDLLRDFVSLVERGKN